MAETANIKDVGSRASAWTIQANSTGAVLNRQWDTEQAALDALKRMQELTPPLLPSGKVVPVLSVIAERRGGPGRKSNAAKAAEVAASAANSSPKPSPTPVGTKN